MKKRGLSLLGSNALLSDASLLTGEVAQVVQLSATNLTNLVDYDAVDVGRLDGEDTLYTNGTRHLANGEALLVAVPSDLDNYTAVQLDTLLVALANILSYAYGVTRLE